MWARPPPVDPRATVPIRDGVEYRHFNDLLCHNRQTLNLADGGLLAELSYALIYDKSDAGLCCGIVDLAVHDYAHADELVSVL